MLRDQKKKKKKKKLDLTFHLNAKFASNFFFPSENFATFLNRALSEPSHLNIYRKINTLLLGDELNHRK